MSQKWLPDHLKISNRYSNRGLNFYNEIITNKQTTTIKKCPVK